jgi:hypothetical protein
VIILEGSKGVEEADNLSGESMKNSLRLLDVVPKPNLSFNKLFKGFKNLSQLFGEYMHVFGFNILTLWSLF